MTFVSDKRHPSRKWLSFLSHSHAFSVSVDLNVVAQLRGDRVEELMESMEIIDLLSDNDDEEGEVCAQVASESAAAKKKDKQTIRQLNNNNPYKNDTDQAANEVHNPYKKKRKTSTITQRKGQLKNDLIPSTRELQAGLVFEEDTDHIQHTSASSLRMKSSSKLGALKNDNENSSSGEDHSDTDQLTKPTSAKEYAQHQLNTRIAHNLPPILYHDPDFVAGNPATIDGSKNKSFTPPKCRCKPSKPCTLAYSTRAGPNYDRPYYCCSKGKSNGCNYFSWAFQSQMLHWYRFGSHNGHVLVKPRLGYRADDLVQGKVGDCWFLSALAVVAERDDLIGRLIGSIGTPSNTSDNYGVIEVKLFVDGYWQSVVMDDFLPCLIDQQSEKEEENHIQLALRQSLVEAGIDPMWNTTMTSEGNKKSNQQKRASSKFDRHSIADECKMTLHDINEFLHSDRFSKDPSYRSKTSRGRIQPLDRQVLTSDLAYSKARESQLWVPFIEKAYAKIHGSYSAISGGHVEEAFLDLTGAPTAVYNFDHHDFNPRHFWSELMQYRKKRLPMGCGTSTSQGGIVGMHAYSILDVREIKNVGVDFFRDKLVTGTLGNVSGFTELDGTVRLLRIRNPHGQGEWKGDFSDKSPVWEKLMANKRGSNGMIDLTSDYIMPQQPQSPELKRTMQNDGTFWIDYDSFLMGFHNVDVVLAFQGNHSKSFGSSFPIKKSNHRCDRAFELSAVGRQPGEEGEYNPIVEVYVMVIQKTRRGASRGRADRKVSYKACDVGIIVGEQCSNSSRDQQLQLGAVDGRFFGVNRNGHIRLRLDRRKPDMKLIVMPIAFGQPAATDDERSFVVRVVSDSPLFVQELQSLPEMNIVMQKYCFGEKVMSLSNAGTSSHRGLQGTKSVLMEGHLFKILRVDCLAQGGGTVLIYLVVNDECRASSVKEAISFSIEVNCRGMICRTADGLEKHEVISKGKKFEAAWRKFDLQFSNENKSRLLAAVVQGGQDHQMGSIKCSLLKTDTTSGPMSKYMNVRPSTSTKKKCQFGSYEDFGVFAAVDTPPNAFSSQCIDLLSTIHSKNTHFGQENEPIDLCHDSAPLPPRVDQNLDAAIMASILESSSSQDNIGVHNSYDQDIEKAIAMSLKDK